MLLIKHHPDGGLPMPSESTNHYLIWWLNQADCQAIGQELTAEVPQYLRDQYRSRLGRPGRGRLWQSSEAIPDDVSVDPWPDTALARVFSGDYGGIVIRPDDLPHVAQLPGVVTDTTLRRVN